MPSHVDPTDGPAEEPADLRILGAVEDAFAQPPTPSDQPGEREGPDPVEEPMVPDAEGEAAESSIDLVERSHDLTDPDPGRRRLAFERAVQSPFGLSLRDVERGLQDPDDGIRAAAVQVAVLRGPAVRSLLIPLVGARRWPMAQEATLRVLPGLLEQEPPTERDLRSLLWVIGVMEPPPYGDERPSMGALARAVGTDRLSSWLGREREARLGAVRLLLAEGGAGSLLILATLEDDPVPEVRSAAAYAESLLLPEPAGAAGSPTSDPRGRSEEASDDPAIIGALARGLLDPDPLVREAAAAALARVGGGAVARWATAALQGRSPEVGGHAAAAVESLRLMECAGPVLERACVTPPEGRGPYVGALVSLDLSPVDLAHLAAACDPSDRQEAVRVAWRVGGRPVLPMLQAFMEETIGVVRLAVLEVFHDAGDPAAPILARRALIEDSSVAVRALAVRILAGGDADSRRQALEQALADPDPDVRATAVDTLPVGMVHESSDLLLRAIRESDERVWRAALRHLVTLPGPDHPELWTALRESPAAKREAMVRWIERSAPDRLAPMASTHATAERREDRALAVQLAARAGDRASTRIVLDALEDPDPGVRRASAAAMSELRSPGAVPALARSLLDPSTDVRVEAVRALALIDDDTVPATLIAALKDPEARVGDLAGEALARSRSPGVARALAEALSSPDLRRPAGTLLEQMGDPAVGPLIDLIIRSSDPGAKTAAGEVLGRVVGADTFGAGLVALDPEERLRSAEVLGAIGGPAAAEHLLAALSDPEQRVRVRVITLLGTFGDPRAVEPLRRTLRTDPVHEAAAAAAAALRQLGDLPPSLGDEEQQP